MQEIQKDCLNPELVFAFDILARQRQFTIFTLNFPVGSPPNLGVSHHLEVIITSKHLLVQFLHLVFYTLWSGEAVIY